MKCLGMKWIGRRPTNNFTRLFWVFEFTSIICISISTMHKCTYLYREFLTSYLVKKKVNCMSNRWRHFVHQDGEATVTENVRYVLCALILKMELYKLHMYIKPLYAIITLSNFVIIILIPLPRQWLRIGPIKWNKIISIPILEDI